MISLRMAVRNISRRKSRNILTVFAIILGTALLVGVNVATTSAMAEYTRMHACIRSQGMSRNQILGMLLTEACFMGIIGFLIGLPIGLLLLKSATSTTTITGFWLPYIIPWSTITQALAFALIASLAGALYPALKASRMSITRALQQR